MGRATGKISEQISPRKRDNIYASVIGNWYIPAFSHTGAFKVSNPFVDNFVGSFVPFKFIDATLYCTARERS